MLWPWKSGQRSAEVIGTDTDRSATYDFLLTLQSNHETISYRFRDKRRFAICDFSRKSLTLSDLFPLELGTDARDQNTRMICLPEGQNSFKIGLAV